MDIYVGQNGELFRHEKVNLLTFGDKTYEFSIQLYDKKLSDSESGIEYMEDFAIPMRVLVCE